MARVDAPVPTRARRPRLQSEEALGAHAANAEYARSRLPPRARTTRTRRTAELARYAVGLPATLYLFVVALKLLSASAPQVANLFQRFGVDSVVNLVGFGWLAAYGSLSGSPVAALAMSLLDGGAIDGTGALGMLAGSRMGASFVVLLVGFVAYTRGRRRPDGIYVGVLALLTTITVYIPATALALWLLGTGWMDAPAGAIPTGWADAPGVLARPVVRALSGWLPGALLFAAGIGALFGAFAILDRLLPNLDPPSARFERFARHFRSARAMFVFGALITSLTMSVSLSVTILVPLTLKGYVRRRDVVPYIMGANITTFVDTLFASLILDTASATPVVLAEMLAVTIVSVLVLALAWPWYIRTLLAVTQRVMSDRRALGTFLAGLAGIPLALLFVL
jgi:Na+/phosphate symporter